MDKHWGDGWGDVMQYGWFWFVSRPLNFLLNTYHDLLDGIAHNWSWGLAIILLTITVRIVIWPLHAKSTHTMKRMAKLKPEMDKLKEKYPDDPNKLNTEMMGLYRKFGINPLGGCLPMFIQIPIFFGFYRMLQYAVELRGQGFLWVNDLSQPDTLAHISGVPINLLPVVMAITSFLQIKMTPMTGDKMQQRIIMFMPFMFFFFCYNFASALALYWTTQNIFSIGQTWLMSKVPEPELKPVKGAGKSWVQRMAETPGRDAEAPEGAPGRRHARRHPGRQEEAPAAHRRLRASASPMPSESSTLPPASPGVVFEARKLRKVYHTGELDVVALDGVDLELNAGDLVCLLGASGSGKSTLLNILGGLDLPTSGELIYKGWALDGSRTNKRSPSSAATAWASSSSSTT